MCPVESSRVSFQIGDLALFAFRNARIEPVECRIVEADTRKGSPYQWLIEDSRGRCYAFASELTPLAASPETP